VKKNVNKAMKLALICSLIFGSFTYNQNTNTCCILRTTKKMIFWTAVLVSSYLIIKKITEKDDKGGPSWANRTWSSTKKHTKDRFGINIDDEFENIKRKTKKTLKDTARKINTKIGEFLEEDKNKGRKNLYSQSTNKKIV